LTAANAPSLGVDDPTPQQLGRPVFGPERVKPAWDGIFELQPAAASTYHGVTLSLNRRVANEIEWACSYTWSHARDSASEFDEQPQNPYALADEWADSRYDQRHRFVASALFDLPIGEEEDRKPGEEPGAWIGAFSHIEMAPNLTIGSGGPVNAVTGGDDNRTGAFPFTSRPLGFSRNAARLPSTATLDLRILKYFTIKPHGKLDLVVDAFATALERHLNWKYSVPAYIFSSYVAISRLPANRHWLSDAVFGSAVGIIAGRTVTSHESERPYPVAVAAVPGGMAIMYVHRGK
jgi:hypothetical protein